MGPLILHIRTDVENLRGLQGGMTKLVLNCQWIGAFEMEERPCGVPDVLPGEFVHVDSQIFEQDLEWLVNTHGVLGSNLSNFWSPFDNINRDTQQKREFW